MRTRKVSVTVDEDLVDEVRSRVGARGFSRFVNGAIRSELEHGELAALVADLERELGPPDVEMMAEASELFDALDIAQGRPRQG